jgi:hypothetical protein
MIEIQKKAFDKTLQFLDGLNCQYLIIDEDGNEYGKLNKEGRVKRNSKYPHGVLSGYIKPFITELGIGKVVCIPFGEFLPNDLQSSASAYANTLWGKKSYSSHVNKETKVLEFLRIA